MELEDYYKPFEDFENSIYKNVFTRVIKEDVELLATTLEIKA